MLCLGFISSGEVLSGDSNGNIQVWSKGYRGRICIHLAKIFCFFQLFQNKVCFLIALPGYT